MNEILLIVTLIVEFSTVLLMWKFLGKTGLYVFTALATILSNIEVLILVKAFGMEMTLGNILFAATFLVTDILSENCGKKDANRAVIIGMVSSAIFLVVSQSWLFYKPSVNDVAMGSIKAIFSSTPRLLISSFVVYAVSETFDVWMYHVWWKFTEKKTGDKKGFLWLRNNGSTLLSQLLNAFLFNFAAFYGVYDLKTLISISLSTYVIYIFTSLLDTPFVYLSRKFKPNDLKEQGVRSKEQGNSEF